MFASIHLVSLDGRTGKVYILAGEEIEVLIERNGQRNYNVDA